MKAEFGTNVKEIKKDFLDPKFGDPETIKNKTTAREL